jgi:hypothetical protein
VCFMYRSVPLSLCTLQFATISNKFWMGGGGGRGKVGIWSGEKRGGQVGRKNKRGGGVEGVRCYFTAPEGLVGVGQQCGYVTLPHSSPPWSTSG